MIWCFISQKGGCGKSTLAVHAAAWQASKGRSVLLIDADSQRSSSGWLAEAHLAGVECVTAEDADQLRRRCQASTAAITIIDGAGGISPTTRQALVLADLAIVPSGASALDLRAARHAVELVQQARSVRDNKAPACRLVLNRVQLHTTLGAEALDAIRTLGEPAARAVIRQRTALADAAGQGVVVFGMGTAAADAAADLHALFLELQRVPTPQTV